MNFVKAIANGLRKTPLFVPARTLFSLMIPRLHRSRNQEKAELDNILSKVGDSLQHPLYGSDGPHKAVLIMGMASVRYIALEAAVRKSFELAGYSCKVIVPQESMAIEAYRLLGSDELVFIDHYDVPLRHEGMSLLGGCNSLDEVTELR